MEKEYIIRLIESGYECDYLDFKGSSYSKNNKFELIKDIMAMANSKYDGDKYIITGIKDKPFNEKEVVGINPEEPIDSANYHELITKNVEPDVSFDYFNFQYREKWIGVFKIYNNHNRPYMLKKQHGTYLEGYCAIRKGSHTCIATRSDYDFFYTHNDRFEVTFLENSLHAVHVHEGTADIRVVIRNLTKLPVTIVYGTLYIRNRNNQPLSKHPVYGLNNYIGADFKLYLPPNHEEEGRLFVSFGSTDCLRLGMDEHGTTDQSFIFELIFGDAQGNEYTATIKNGHVFAIGEFLWKVRLNQR